VGRGESCRVAKLTPRAHAKQDSRAARKKPEKPGILIPEDIRTCGMREKGLSTPQRQSGGFKAFSRELDLDSSQRERTRERSLSSEAPRVKLRAAFSRRKNRVTEGGTEERKAHFARQNRGGGKTPSETGRTLLKGRGEGTGHVYHKGNLGERERI